MKVEDVIAQVIKARGMTLVHVSRKTGVKYSKLQPSMQGRRELRADELLAVCAFLGLDPLKIAREIRG